MTRRGIGRVLLVLLQAGALAAGVWYLVHTARAAGPELARFRLAPAPAPLALASILTAATYVYLVGAWVVSLRWWSPPASHRLPFAAALRIWFVTNLARFIPGAVWQFAGLAALAAERGISPVAAAGSILAQQVVLLVTGIGVALALAPGLLGPAAIWIALGAGVALGVAALPPVTSRLRRVIAWPQPSRGALALYVSGLVLPWLAYGVAFWMFGRALLGSDAPGLLVAAGSFTASYVAGIIAVFAPGGIVVREVALVAALSPVAGPDSALLLALASRVWLLAVELLTAAIILVLPKP